MINREKKLQRIKVMLAMLNKERSEYTPEEKRIVRECIDKHAGTEWSTIGYEGEPNES